MSTVQIPKEKAARAFYALIGAPVVAGRRIKEVFAEFDLEEWVGKDLEQWIAEGERLVSKLQERKVVEQVQAKMDVDQLQEQVERLRDQLENVLATWREGFQPSKREAGGRPEAVEEPTEAAAAEAATKKPAAKKTTAKKTTAKQTGEKATAKERAARKNATKKAAAGGSSPGGGAAA